MADWGLNKNAEGYADPTAYKAIAKADAPLPGDIFCDDGVEWLVIAYNDGVINCLKLLDEGKESSVSIISRSLKYTDPRYLQYRFYDPLTFELVKRLPQRDFDSLLDEVSRVLGVPAGSKDVVVVEPKENPYEVIELKQAIKVYKRMYNELLERLIERK